MPDHPLEPMRRKQPLNQLLNESFSSLDHVLGYVTLKLPRTEQTEQIESHILALFNGIEQLRTDLKPLIPADDWS